MEDEDILHSTEIPEKKKKPFVTPKSNAERVEQKRNLKNEYRDDNGYEEYQHGNEFVKKKVTESIFSEPIPSEFISPKKKIHIREKARQKIESILNVRTFIIVVVVVIALGFYIWNVIAINNLLETIKKEKEEKNKLNSIIVEKEILLNQLSRSDNISKTASEKLGLGFQNKSSVEIKK